MYADDTDLYLIFKPSELTENVAEMERTAGLLRRWMAANELKMNDAKTESNADYTQAYGNED